jgi:Uma2 family endonuclease
MSTTTSMTAEQLFCLPADNLRHELIRGELRTMTPAGSEHGATVMNVSWCLLRHNKKRKRGVLFGAETGFVLARDPDTVRASDCAWVRLERIPAKGIPKTFFSGAPDLAVEVVSPGDSHDEVRTKVEDWLSPGTQVVWVVNPKPKTVAVYRAGDPARILTERDMLDCPDLLPGFKVRVSEYFEGL